MPTPSPQRSIPRNQFQHRWQAAHCILRRSAAFLAVSAALTALPAGASEESARGILKAMTDYLAEQRHLSLTYDADIEVVTPMMEKIQFAATGKVMLSRPNRFRVTRTGGYADVELVSDGQTVTVFDRDGNRFARVPGAGSFDATVDRLRSESLIELPGADLLLEKPYETLTADVIEAKHIGRGVIDGVECEHLAFRNLDTDWQIWIELGERPLPRKYVITSKTMAGGPQYSLRMSSWSTQAQPADTFTFTPPAGASGVEITALTDIDEVPRGTVPGGKK